MRTLSPTAATRKNRVRCACCGKLIEPDDLGEVCAEFPRLIGWCRSCEDQNQQPNLELVEVRP